MVTESMRDLGHFVGGHFTAGSGPATLEVNNPVTGEVLACFQQASPEDVGRAVGAAQAAFQMWSRVSPGERSERLHALAAKLQASSDRFAVVESHQSGKPIRLTRDFDVPGSIDNVSFFAGVARHLEGRAAAEYSGDHTSYIRRDPIGTIGAIAPWNYPLQMAVWKLLPAVAAGNTVVLKPAELTPLTSVMLAELAAQAGIPDGVINVVNGPGRTVGRALVEHPGIAMVSFTGSTSVGHGIAQVAAGKRLHLELGGKAPFVVFDDADLDATVRGAVAGAIINAGQDCTAATRAYVQRPLYDGFVDAAADLMSQVRMGDPLDEATDLGSLISHDQRDQVAGFVERARQSGAKIVAGGSCPGGALSAGPYYPPTLVTDVDQRSEIIQREIFGPVLTVLPFDEDDEAFRLANDTPYGLAASAWTRDVFRAQRASRELQAGCVWINDHIPMASEMPHGGWKASGHGKDMSLYSLEEYTNVKHVMSDICGEAVKPWHSVVLPGD